MACFWTLHLNGSSEWLPPVTEMVHWEEDIDGGYLEIAQCFLPLHFDDEVTMTFFRHMTKAATYEIQTSDLTQIKSGRRLRMTPPRRYAWQSDAGDFDTTVEISVSGVDSDSSDSEGEMMIQFTYRVMDTSEDTEGRYISDVDGYRKLVPTGLGNMIWLENDV